MLLSLAATAYSQSAVRQSALPTLSSVVMSARDIGVKELDTEELSTAVLTSKLDACSQRVAELEAALELNARVAEAQLTAEREAAKAVQEADAQLIAKLGSSHPASACALCQSAFPADLDSPRLVCVLTTLFLTVAFNTIIPPRERYQAREWPPAPSPLSARFHMRCSSRVHRTPNSSLNASAGQA